MLSQRASSGAGLRRGASDFQTQFCARTKLARQLSGHTLESMATALAILKTTYAKYEYRTPMPHHMVERYCLITQVDIDWLYTGTVRPPRPRGRPASHGEA